MQAAEELLPVKGLNVPAGQAMQAAEELLPVKGLNVPAGQAMQAAEELQSPSQCIPAGQI